ncbi:hypothetical protein RclHR1_00970008 [Rhizophagus clarus]|uniref:Hsp70 family protein n=1 Tax=Rhizophagus clarus TaxID=94130 RepID=A0A2Z6SQL9_9GLOM|nr:hypothetical protein RclHR1_00970008 [Rhizophagus clarus]GES96673.1 hypothetical protein GLOIN_2v1705943 [Rhizophagus clarus]
MNLLEKFDKLNSRLTNLLEENKELKQQNKILQEENQVLKEKLNEKDYKNLQEENKKLKQHILNLENQQNEQLRKYKNLQKENKRLNERETQFQQHIQNLEKQKSEQFEMFSQNLEKALEKLELDESGEDESIRPATPNEESAPTSLPKKASYLEPETTLLPKEAPNKEPVPFKFKSDQAYFNSYSYLWNENSGNSFNKDNTRVVIGLDFGTTYSGFSYCHVKDPENIITNDQWPGETGNLKTNTVLQYDGHYNVESWGFPALVKIPSHRKNRNNKNPVELFKLHLSNLPDIFKPQLPIEYMKAITDYLHEIGKLIKETIATRWPNCEKILFVLTVPAEYSNQEKAIMRKCVFKAGLIEDIHSENLQFTTEPEAAAIYCLQNLWDLPTGTSFMIVDCGGGTVDLTTRKLIGRNQLGEITESIGDFCGSTFIDQEYIKFLRNKLGSNAIDSFRNEYYEQFQYMIQDFCRRAKLPFTGDDLDFSYELDIEEFPILLEKYVSQETKDELEENENLIKVNYDDVKAMFDPVIDRIIKLIYSQLSNAREKCSLMFLVGGFSQSKYLQKRIRQEFQNQVNNISVPNQPVAATSRGATLYGLSLLSSTKSSEMNNIKCIITTRVIKFTYGVKIRNYWMEGDPIERKLRGGRIDKFHYIVKRGTVVNIDQVIAKIYTPLSPMQTRVCFKIYYTMGYDAKYCDDPGVMFLGKLNVELPHSGLLDKLLFGFIFGRMEIIVTARNEANGQCYKTTVEIFNE